MFAKKKAKHFFLDAFLSTRLCVSLSFFFFGKTFKLSKAHQRLDKQARDELLEGGEAVLQKRQQKKEDDAARKTEALNQQLRDANRT